jgi:CRP-like cAMP-binding protein
LISADHLKAIAPWARELEPAELERAARGTTVRAFDKGSYILHRGDRLDAWIGVIGGLVKVSAISSSGKAVSFAGVPAGGWLGEGTVLKNEARQYDLVAVRDSRVAFMAGTSFRWLADNSFAFNRFLVRQLNERLGQFIALVASDRMLDATARLARCISWLFNAVLYPNDSAHLEVSQEELGLLSGLSRQAANKALQELEDRGLLRLERQGITVLDLRGLARVDE